MPTQKPSSRSRFTEAARAAALEARRCKREAAIPRETPEVFVVRLPSTALPFGWEVRRFGAVVLDRSRTGYPTVGDARAAGDDALERRPPGPDRAGRDDGARAADLERVLVDRADPPDRRAGA